MRPISLASFLAAALMLGVSLLWFPDIVDIVSALMPVGTPDFIIDFLAILPYLTETVILILLVIKLTKRGRPKDFEQ